MNSLPYAIAQRLLLYCESTRRLRVCGISYDGGYEQYMVVPVECCLPDSPSDVNAARLLCAGTINALRHSVAWPGELVAVQGIGGPRHLGIQFANKFGYKIVAISRARKGFSRQKACRRALQVSV